MNYLRKNIIYDIFDFYLQSVESCRTVTVYKSPKTEDHAHVGRWRQNPYLFVGKPPPKAYKPPLIPGKW